MEKMALEQGCERQGNRTVVDGTHNCHIQVRDNELKKARGN